MISPFIFLFREIISKIYVVLFLLCWFPSPKYALTQKNEKMYMFLSSLLVVVCKWRLPKGHLNKDETLESTVLANSTPYAVVIKITVWQSLKHEVICRYLFIHPIYPTHYEPLKAQTMSYSFPRTQHNVLPIIHAQSMITGLITECTYQPDHSFRAYTRLIEKTTWRKWPLSWL